MMGQYDLDLLDRWRLTHQGRVIRLCPREQRVLALVAIRGAAPRRRLATELWPKVSESLALDSLRVSLHHIHRLAPNLLHCAEGWLELSEHTGLDLRQLVTELEHGLKTGELPAQTLQQLLHGGELLPDWDEAWLLLEQKQLQSLRARALEAGAGQQLEAGQHQRAVQLARVAVQVDPISERAASVLARAQAQAGNRAGATAELLHFVRRLHEDLGINPGPEISHTLAQLRSN